MEEKRYLAEQLPDDVILMDLVHRAFRFLFTDELGQYVLAMLGIHYASCVLDTNFILRDISWTLKKQRTSSLILASRVGTLRLYASTQVRAEVPKKIQTRAASFKIDPEAACKLWETMYKPFIRFLDPEELGSKSKLLEALRQRDLDDLPTAQLIEVLRPTVVLSEDKDLAAFGTIVVPPTQITSAYRDHAERDAQFVILGLGGGVVLRVSLAMLTLLAKLLVRLDRRVLIILSAIVGLLFAIPVTRRVLIRNIQALRVRLEETGLNELLSNAIEGFALVESETKEARKFLLQQERHRLRPKKAVEYIIEVLTLTGDRLSAREITQRMIAKGYKPRGQAPERYVRQLLGAHPQLFTQQKGRRWSIASLEDEENMEKKHAKVATLDRE